MSIYVMAPVLKCAIPDVPRHDDGTKGCDGSTMKLVALGLADSANEDGTGARPGVRALAEFAQCHTDTVVRALRTLAALGAITLTDTGRGFKGRATYTVHVEWFTRGVSERHRATLPTRHCASGPRNAPDAPLRGPEPRNASARPEPRSYVPPVVTSPDEPANDDTPTVPPDVARSILQRSIEEGRRELPRRPDPWPWELEGIPYGTWIRRERAAGRVSKHYRREP